MHLFQRQEHCRENRPVVPSYPYATKLQVENLNPKEAFFIVSMLTRNTKDKYLPFASRIHLFEKTYNNFL